MTNPASSYQVLNSFLVENSLAGNSRINGGLISWIAALKNLPAFSQGPRPHVLVLFLKQAVERYQQAQPCVKKFLMQEVQTYTL
jgi:hypothetical protein